MAAKYPICDLDNYVGEDVRIAGWVNTLRDQKKMQFMVLRDRSGMVQTVNQKDGKPLDDVISSLAPEATVVVEGTVVANPSVRLNGYEITVNSLDVTSMPTGPLPISQESGLEHRLDWRHVDLRDPRKRLIFEVQTAAEHAMRAYWRERGFIEVHSPKFVEGATESGSELFQLDYFGETASLAQSPQFYKQMAMAAGFERIFEIGPVFRANPSFTSRHDTEFTSVDTEISWIDSHEDVMAFEEGWLQYVLCKIEHQYGEEIHKEFGTDVVVPTTPFPRIPMAEAYKIVEGMGYQIPRASKGDLDPQAERLLSQYVQDKFGHEFVFVTNYPVGVRPFYHMRFPDQPDTTKSFDLLWKGLEVTTGAQREHRHDVLEAQALEKGIELDGIKHYLNFFKHGCPPHGGYGFGLTRMLMKMLDVPNVREVTFLYRGPNRLSP